jgi:hypothetical protein
VRLAENQHSIQALAAQSADQTVHMTIFAMVTGVRSAVAEPMAITRREKT